jgi:hypothetical protein
MFYTYLWLREDGTPYYVGKGCGNRAYKKHRKHGWPPPIDRIVFYVARDEAESFENEVALIWYYGRKDLGTGCLINLTNGGEGISGAKLGVRSEEHKNKLRKVHLGRKASKETREKQRLAKLGKKRPFTKEHINNLTEVRRARPLTPETEQPKGIFWRPQRNKWEARIRMNGKPIYLGRYEKRYQAVDVWDKAFLKAFGMSLENN